MIVSVFGCMLFFSFYLLTYASAGKDEERTNYTNCKYIGECGARRMENGT